MRTGQTLLKLTSFNNIILLKNYTLLLVHLNKQCSSNFQSGIGVVMTSTPARPSGWHRVVNSSGYIGQIGSDRLSRRHTTACITNDNFH